MKTSLLISFCFLGILLTKNSTAQVNSNGNVASAIYGENPFFDASSNFDLSVNANSAGKGMLFPRTDLTNWSFSLHIADGINFPSAFSGMIVFNVGTGYTPKDEPNGITDTTYVTPGFYYFYNPNAGLNSNGSASKITSIAGGYWIRLYSDKDIAEKDTADITTYYGLLSTTTPDESDITGLTMATVKSGIYAGKFDLSLPANGYYTVAVPVDWRNPSLCIEGDKTFNVLIPVKNIKIKGKSYQIWQTDIELTAGLSVTVN